MVRQLSLRYIKDESKPNMAHFKIYSVLVLTGIAICNMFFGIAGAITGFIILFLVAIYIDQRLIARKLEISSRLMSTCIGLDLSIHIEPVANRSLRVYTKIIQNIKNIDYNKDFIEMADKCCADYLLLLGLICRNGLYNRYSESLSELVTIFENISNAEKFNIIELNKLVDLKNRINKMVHTVSK